MTVKQANIDKRALTLKDVEQDFSKYNFIISTTVGVIDTTEYKQAKHQTTQLTGLCANDEGHLAMTTVSTSDWTDQRIIDKEARTIIFDKTVQNIKVKNIKDFINK